MGAGGWPQDVWQTAGGSTGAGGRPQEVHASDPLPSKLPYAGLLAHAPLGSGEVHAERELGRSSGKGPSEAVANSMTPHLAMHSTRGVESGRGRRELKKQKDKYQKTVYGAQALPPDEATPFFTTYVLHYAFPTIAIICTCLGCVLLRTMKMYQKERWKGTSYFHGNSFPAAA